MHRVWSRRRASPPGAGAPARWLSHSLTPRNHDNPLGLPPRPAAARAPRFPEPGPGIPRKDAPPPLPRRGGPPAKRRIEHVKKVIVVASGKGGVGKSTVAANLALALAAGKGGGRRRVGLLDLDVYGPSVPTLMGLEGTGEPELTQDNALVPLENHGIRCMSIGFLIPPSALGKDNKDSPVVWRGMMVMKAVQQLLFDVDWRGRDRGNAGLDALVIDMPPGTGDVALSLGQLAEIDGAVIVSTPQDVALLDARKGVAMFRKLSVPVLGAVLNMSYFLCPSCATPHRIFGSSAGFMDAAKKMEVDVLGEVPMEEATSASGDAGRPLALNTKTDEGSVSREALFDIASKVWSQVQ